VANSKEAKTRATKESVTGFLKKIEDEQQRKDCLKIKKLFADVTGKRPKMWGDTIIGFGKYKYQYDSGQVTRSITNWETSQSQDRN